MTSQAGKKVRLKSLDTFRGISIAIMIFVNDGAGGYYFFEHATWNGLYVADLAFPWFMWIMGFCIPMSVRSFTKKDTPLPVILWRIAKRSFKLFFLGLFFANRGRIDLYLVRIPGVLQRFAITYFVVASTAALAAKLAPRTNREYHTAKVRYPTESVKYTSRPMVGFSNPLKFSNLL